MFVVVLVQVAGRSKGHVILSFQEPTMKVTSGCNRFMLSH